MRLPHVRLPSALLVFCFLLFYPAGESQAQSYSQTARPFLQDVSGLSFGDAGVAIPSTYGGFFLNPAQPAAGAPAGVSVRALGANVSVSANTVSQWNTFQNKVRPAIERGYDNLSGDEQDDILKAIAAGYREETVLSAGAVIPHVVYKKQGIALGGGIAAHTAGRYRVSNAGAQVPFVLGVARGDLMGIATASADLTRWNGPPLNIGVTLKHTQRYATSKNKALDAFSKQEDVYLMEGSSTSVDLGVLYELPVPWSGKFYGAAAVFDLTRDPFNFSLSQNVTDRRAIRPSQVSEEGMFLTRQLEHHTSYRIGVGQVWGPAQNPRAAIALDYLGFTSPLKPQAPLAHLRMGVKAQLLTQVALQAGLNQGYPTLGATVSAGPAHLSYAFFGVEEGRIPGQMPSWNHAAQIVFSW